MSPRTTLVTAAVVSLCALPVAAAGAKSHAHKPAKAARAEAGTIVAATTGLGQLPAHAKLGPAHRVDIGAMRHVRSAKRSARKHARAVLPAGKSVGAKVLLLSANTSDPSYAWWTSALKTDGVPFDAIVTRDTPITTDLLQTDADHGNYEAVILASGSLMDWSSGSGVDTMTPDEWTALQGYEKAFAIREINAYDYPQPMFGTGWGGNCGDKSGTTATVTPAGASVFTDLAGSFPVDSGVFGCETTPWPGSAWQTLISGPNGGIVGTTIRTDGVETMFDSYSGADWTIYTRLLAHGMLNWVTKGVYLGMHRDYFRLDVDDVFLGNDRWDPATHALNPDESSIIRMTPNDVLRAAQWEQKSGVQLNFLFNGDGADPTGASTSNNSSAATARSAGAPHQTTTTTQSGTTTTAKAPPKKQPKPKPVKPIKVPKNVSDPLTVALLLTKDQFRWTNHTFTHPELDASDEPTIESEIKQNIDFGTKYKLPFDKTELVTGGHTGYQNPNMPDALAKTGIKWFGEDNSRQPKQYGLANALSVPRWPTGVYYNVGTKAEELDEYNYLNYSICGDHQGHGIGCLPAPVTSYDQFVNNEAGMIIRHILDNDPRPHYVHQSNLAEDGTMYPVFDEVLRRFHAYVNTPLVQPTETEEGQTLQQQAAWNAAVDAGSVTGTITSAGLTVTSTVPDLMVPATGIRAGSLYGGLRSGWMRVGAGTTNLGL